MPPTLRSVALATAMMIGVTLDAQAPSAPAAMRAASWDTVVSVISRTWIDRPFVESRWIPEATRRRTTAIAAQDEAAFRQAMHDLLGLVPASHFYVIPASAFEADARGAAPGTTGLSLRLAQRDGVSALLVTAVEPSSPAELKGIRPGTEIVAIDGRDVASRLRVTDTITVDAARHRARAALLQRANSIVAPAASDSVVLSVRGPTEVRAGRVALTAIADTTPTASFGNLPPLSTRVRARRANLGDGRAVGVIGFDVWVPAAIPPLDAAFAASKSCDGLVLDLRGNLGGVVGMVMGVGGHLFDTTAVLATMTSRDASLRLVANPRRVLGDGTRTSPYAGPVALLVDLLTASTSEIFAGALSELGRARVFGERTAGQALPALTARLANGDVLVHATADLTGPAGRRFDGVGITPHVPVTVTAEALAQGRDPVLEAALAWLSTFPDTRAANAATCLP